MDSTLNRYAHAAAVALCVALGGCPAPPVVPTRPAERLALVELQINNTATQADDYVPAGVATPARLRLINGAALAGPVPVTLKNLDFQSAPALAFAASGAPTAASLDLTLPVNGSWVPFVVAGGAGQASSRDKDAVIEILERRVDGIVLGRKSLMVSGANPTGPPPFRVEIEVGGLETIDDYLTWRPQRARVRFAHPPGGGADVPVVIRNMTPATAGQLVFGAAGTSVTAAPPTMAATLSATLPRNGRWLEFFVAGDFGHPSADDKDAVLEVVRVAGNKVLGREGVMVRVRKNANTLTTAERDRFINAIARLNLSLGNYVVHQQIHAVASTQGHGGPGFLAWHRAYILRYERELQAIDPAVTLHYWRFDAAAPAMFAASFMGGPPNLGGFASFDPTNPLASWSIEGLSGIPRRPFYAPAQSPTTLGIADETATLALGGSSASYGGFRAMEGNPHGNIHGLTGGGGWVGSVPTAARDPLFFLLHANVDRLWAKWQWLYVRDEPAATSSYDPQGAYATGGSFRLGQYAQDRMWPWDGTTGVVVPGDLQTERPAIAPGGQLPAPIGGWGPPSIPRPADVIDYDRWIVLGPSGLGYGYDDVPFAQAGTP
jgi:tyrosinase